MNRRRALTTISAIGVGQIFAWGSSFYLIAVLAGPVARETGWPMTWIVSGHSFALFIAGLASPKVGRVIEQVGGGRVLATGSLLLASGQILLAATHHIAVWFAAWFVLGVGMACCLYDAAFATLGQIFGAQARRAITNVTLFGGLASTICWPLSAVLIDDLGWRGACLVYAALQIVALLPMHLFALPAPAAASVPAPSPRRKDGGGLSAVHVLLGAILTLAAAIGAIVSVHLITLLQARGLALAAAVGMGAIFGPAQVGARVVELALGRHYHPVWTLLASVLFVCVGVGLLGIDGPVALIAGSLVLYGAGNGLNSVARGTAPLALFGAEGYARLMGRLAAPALLAQALAPPLVALFIERGDSAHVLPALAGLALLNCLLAALLIVWSRRLREA